MLTCFIQQLYFEPLLEEAQRQAKGWSLPFSLHVNSFVTGVKVFDRQISTLTS